MQSLKLTHSQFVELFVAVGRMNTLCVRVAHDCKCGIIQKEELYYAGVQLVKHPGW